MTPEEVVDQYTWDTPQERQDAIDVLTDALNLIQSDPGVEAVDWTSQGIDVLPVAMPGSFVEDYTAPTDRTQAVWIGPDPIDDNTAIPAAQVLADGGAVVNGHLYVVGGLFRSHDIDPLDGIVPYQSVNIQGFQGTVLDTGTAETAFVGVYDSIVVNTWFDAILTNNVQLATYEFAVAKATQPADSTMIRLDLEFDGEGNIRSLVNTNDSNGTSRTVTTVSDTEFSQTRASDGFTVGVRFVPGTSMIQLQVNQLGAANEVLIKGFMRKYI